MKKYLKRELFNPTQNCSEINSKPTYHDYIMSHMIFLFISPDPYIDISSSFNPPTPTALL